ncbi:MAG: hypothetical protein H6906_02850 [Hyphomicrobiales bacterium]|nr:hypothetical protein [Hyphomicrobiales bacterium]
MTRHLLAALAAVLVTLPAGAAEPLKGRVETSDCWDGWAACAAQRHYERMSDAYRARADNCVNFLDDALYEEDQAVPLSKQLGTTYGSAAQPIRAEFDKHIHARNAALEQYRDCIYKGPPALANTGLDPKKAVPQGPQGPQGVDLSVPAEPKGALGKAMVAADKALAPWGKQLSAVSKILADMSDYDMTGRPDAGVKVMGDIFTDMALGHLVKGIPKALKGMKGARQAAKEADLAANATRRGTPKARGGIVATADVAGDAWKAQLPDGTQLPADLLSKPRTVYAQGKEYSCAVACTRMVSKTMKGTAMPEAWYRRLSRDVLGGGYNAASGTPPGHIPELLRRSGIPNSGLRTSTTLDDLARATAQGHPAIVGLNRQHAVVVDAVVNTPKGRYVLYRDPRNLAVISDPRTRQFLQKVGFLNHVAATEQEFMRNFGVNGGGQFGQAIFTGP